MRTGAAILLAALSGACTPSQGTKPVDRIELRLSGWTAVDVEVGRGGEGHYHLSEPLPQGRSGAFRIAPRQFETLVERLRPYRAQAVPMDAKSAAEMVNRRCEAHNFVTDQGGVWVHWIGPDTNAHYLADLGCDPGRYAARNADLLSILHSLPVPFDR